MEDGAVGEHHERVAEDAALASAQVIATTLGTLAWRAPHLPRPTTALVDEAMPWKDLESAVRGSIGTSGSLLDSVDFVTVFRGRKIPKGRKAVTLRLLFRAPDRTLRHEEVDPEMASITTALETAGGESLTHREALTFVKGSKKGKKR